VKTIRKIKILLTTREILVTGFEEEKTAATNLPICPVCHSPLPALSNGEAELIPNQSNSETQKLEEGEN